MKKPVFRLVTAGLVLPSLLGGCSLVDPQSNPTSNNDTAKAADHLKTLPSLEDTEVQANTVMKQIAAAATELVPGMTWSQKHERRLSSCGSPYDRTNGQKVTLPFYTSTTSIPDPVWPQYIDRVRQIASTMGATTQEIMQNQPGKHEIWFSNPEDGTQVSIADAGASVITITVGCRLQKDRFNQPTPTP